MRGIDRIHINLLALFRGKPVIWRLTAALTRRSGVKTAVLADKWSDSGALADRQVKGLQMVGVVYQSLSTCPGIKSQKEYT